MSEEEALDRGLDPTVNHIEELLTNVSVLVRNSGRMLMAEHGVTPPQFHALLLLRELGETRMGELCERMYLACSTLTDLVTRLERRGYVERRRDRNDRRVTKVRILEAGEAIIDKVLEARRRYLAWVLEPLSHEQRGRIRSVLEELWLTMTREA